MSFSFNSLPMFCVRKFTVMDLIKGKKSLKGDKKIANHMFPEQRFTYNLLYKTD